MPVKMQNNIKYFLEAVLRYFQSVYNTSKMIKALYASVVTSPLCARKVGQNAVNAIEKSPALFPYHSEDHLNTRKRLISENRNVIYLPLNVSEMP